MTVQVINDLLSSVEQLSKGQGLSEEMILQIHKQYREVEGSTVCEILLCCEINKHLDECPFCQCAKCLFADVYSGVTVDVPGSPATSRRSKTSEGDTEHEEDENREAEVVPESSDSEEDLEYSEDVNSHVIEDGMRMRKLSGNEAQSAWMPGKLHDPEEVEGKYNSLRSTHLTGKDFEELERQSAQAFTEKLLKFLPSLLNNPSAYDIDQSILKFSSEICDSKYPYAGCFTFSDFRAPSAEI